MITAATLTPILWILTGIALLSFVVLGRAARRPPRIGSLTERTMIAFVIFVLGGVSSVLRYNTDTGFSLFPQQVAALTFAITILVILLIHAAWLVRWYQGKLG